MRKVSWFRATTSFRNRPRTRVASLVVVPGRVDLDGVVAEVRQHEVAEQLAAVCMWVRAHPPRATRRELGKVGMQPAAVVEQLLGPVAAQPVLEQREVVRILTDVGHRDLVGAPAALGRKAVDLFRARPALRRPEHDHRPGLPRRRALVARRVLDLRDPVERPVERGREGLMHQLGLVAFDQQRLPAVPAEERDELVLRDPGEHGRVRDLVAVQVQDRQDGAVGLCVQELVRVPARGERACLGLAVAHDAGDDQVGVVEGGAERVDEGVPELAALVDRARHLRRDVARDPARERELAEQRPEPRLVLGDVRVALGVRPLEVGVRDERRPAVTRTGHVDRVQVALPDRPVQVDVDRG